MMLGLALLFSFVTGMFVAVVGLWNLLVAPLQRSVDALEEKVDKLGADDASRKSSPTSSRDSGADSDQNKRRTLLPQGPDDVPLFGFVAREPSDTLPSAAPTS